MNTNVLKIFTFPLLFLWIVVSFAALAAMYTFAERRAGGPGVLVGSAEKAIRELHWKPEFNSLEKIIQTVWNWHTNNPTGYAITKVS